MTTTKELAELIAAANAALDSGGGLRYDSDDDEVGSHACCQTLSYRDHADDCWVSRLRDALAKFGGGPA